MNNYKKINIFNLYIYVYKRKKELLWEKYLMPLKCLII